MSVKQYIPAIKYGNGVAVDEMDFVSAGPIGNAGINPSISQTVTVNLTSAQILGMFGSPVTLVTTTTPGTAIILDSAFLEVPLTLTTYTAGGTIVINYNGTTSTSGGVLSSGFPSSVFLTATAAGYYMSGQTNTSAGVTTVIPNTGLSIGNQTAAFAGGTNTAKVTVNYYIVTL